ncbi:unnamed protein product [Protopolystoma xenopodis]|uniref:Uncharacterized protein n=1 Tax=Protopolystoma xenopodis TaxID=117903 RepID=A0A3S5AZR8_9PLAT|nr:unnamed protein product [Protopolystoma xenopodis]
MCYVIRDLKNFSESTNCRVLFKRQQYRLMARCSGLLTAFLAHELSSQYQKPRSCSLGPTSKTCIADGRGAVSAKKGPYFASGPDEVQEELIETTDSISFGDNGQHDKGNADVCKRKRRRLNVILQSTELPVSCQECSETSFEVSKSEDVSENLVSSGLPALSDASEGDEAVGSARDNPNSLSFVISSAFSKIGLTSYDETWIWLVIA